MSAKQTVYASEIKPFASVMSIFDGSSDFAIETPYFALPGCKPVDPKAWMNAIPDKKGGLFLNAPRLFMKNATTKVFTSMFVIGWTSVVQNQKLKKEYRIHAPVAQEELKRKQKLMAGPTAKELGPDDNNLILFDWQMSLALDVLLISKILKLHLGKYKGFPNDKFYHAYIADINDALKKLKATTMMEYDEELVNSWNHPPVLSKSKRKEDIFVYDLTDPQTPALEPLMQGFYESITSIKGKQPAFDPPAIDRVWSRPNCFTIPTFKLKTYISKKDPDAGTLQAFDARLLFLLKVPETDKEYNAKFPEGLCTNKQVSRAKKVKLTKQDLPELWGATTFNPNPEKHESAKFSGCIFLTPTISFSFHEKGNPSLDWRVDTFALTRVISSFNDDVDDAGDFVGEEPELSQTGGGEENFGSEFMGNENEVDPDALA